MTAIGYSKSFPIDDPECDENDTKEPVAAHLKKLHKS
jgi:hypothetical protein